MLKTRTPDKPWAVLITGHRYGRYVYARHRYRWRAQLTAWSLALGDRDTNLRYDVARFNTGNGQSQHRP